MIKFFELLVCLGATAGVGLAKDRGRPAAMERARVKKFIFKGGDYIQNKYQQTKGNVGEDKAK